MGFKDSIWDEMERMQRRMNKLFKSREFSDWEEENFDDYRKARLEAKQDEKNFVVNIEIPGAKKEDIKLDVLDNGIEIKAEIKREEKKESKEGKSYYTSSSGFYRYFDVPENADLDNIDASYKDGVLTIKIPKTDKKKGREIRIK